MGKDQYIKLVEVASGLGVKPLDYVREVVGSTPTSCFPCREMLFSRVSGFPSTGKGSNIGIATCPQ